MAFQLLIQYHDFQFLKECSGSLNFYLVIWRQMHPRKGIYWGLWRIQAWILQVDYTAKYTYKFWHLVFIFFWWMQTCYTESELYTELSCIILDPKCLYNTSLCLALGCVLVSVPMFHQCTEEEEKEYVPFQVACRTLQ